MPEFASFDPQGAGWSQSASLMDRAAMQRRAEAEFQQKQAQDALLAPLVAAKAEADMVKTANDLSTAKKVQQNRINLTGLKSLADDDFDAVFQMTDPDKRAQGMLKWIGQYGQLESLAEHSDDIKSKKDVASKIITDANAVRNLNMAQTGKEDITRMVNERVAATTAATTARITSVEQERDAARVEAARIKAEADKYKVDAEAAAKRLAFEGAGGVAQQKALNKSIAATVDAAMADAANADLAKGDSARARAFLDSGITTGKFSESILGVQKAINTFLPGLFNTAGAEALKTTYSDMALSAASRMRGQGQITENERKLLADTVAQMGNSPEAAKYILDYMDAVSDRSIALAHSFAETVDSGTAVKMGDKMKFLTEHPLSSFLKTSAPTGVPLTPVKTSILGSRSIPQVE
jgi:hypothetical protein